MSTSNELILSIIVPVYNAERYLEECLRSLLVQDLPSEAYEVIAVENGSRDSSAAIIDRLQTEYRNLRKVTLETNQLPSGARNAGMNAAKGKYLMFVDSDDYLYPDILEVLVAEMEREENLDFILYDSAVLHEGEIYYRRQKMDASIVSGIDLYHAYADELKIVSWSKIYSRAFIERNHLRFKKGLLYEDDEFAFRLFSLATRVRHIDVVPYVYRENMNSITKNRETLLAISSNLTEINVLYDDLYGTHPIIKDKKLVSEIDRFIRYCIDEVYRIYPFLHHDDQKEAKKLMRKEITWAMWNYMSRKRFILLKLGIIR